MKYLKKYQTRAEYEIAKNNLIRPNISYIVQENSVAFMPNETAIEVTFRVEDHIKGSNEETFEIPIMFAGDIFCFDEEPQEPVQNIRNEKRKYNFFNNNNGKKSNAQCVRVYPAEWFEKIEVDGVALPKVETTINIETGEHVVRYVLKKDAGKDFFETFGYDSDYIEKYTGKTVPPCFLNGTQIKDGNFYSYSTNIKLSSNILAIGADAFGECMDFQSINISNVELIDELAFQNCTALTSVEFSKNISFIGQSAFANCYNLNTVIFPRMFKDIFEIREWVFDNCYNLNTVELPKNLEYIPDRMFYGCNNLYGIVLPEDTNSFGESAFSNTNISDFYVPNDGCVNIGNYAFANIGQDLVTLHLQVNAYCGWINELAFDGCNSVKIHVPDGSVNDFANSGNGWANYYIYSDNGDYYDPNEQEVI